MSCESVLFVGSFNHLTNSYCSVIESALDLSAIPTATKVREYLLLDGRAEWHKHVPTGIQKHYARLREELLASKPLMKGGN